MKPITKINFEMIAEALQLSDEYMKRRDEKYKSSPEMQQIVQWEQWVKSLEHDRPMYAATFDHLLPNIDALAKAVGKSRKDIVPKGYIPTREELRFYQDIATNLKEGNYVTPNISTFIMNIHQIVAQVKAHHPSSIIVRDLAKANKLHHAVQYLNEINYIKKMKEGIDHDDKRWSYFRGELYNKREKYAQQFADRYHHSELRNFFLKWFEEHHADKDGTSTVLGKVIERMQSPQAIQQIEQEGLQQLQQVINSFVQHILEQLEHIRLSAKNAFEDRITQLKHNLAKEEKKIGTLVRHHDASLWGLALEQQYITEISKHMDEVTQKAVALEQEKSQIKAQLKSLSNFNVAQREPLKARRRALNKQIRQLLKEKKSAAQRAEPHQAKRHRILLMLEDAAEKALPQLRKELNKPVPTQPSPGERQAA